MAAPDTKDVSQSLLDIRLVGDILCARDLGLLRSQRPWRVRRPGVHKYRLWEFQEANFSARSKGSGKSRLLTKRISWSD